MSVRWGLVLGFSLCVVPPAQAQHESAARVGLSQLTAPAAAGAPLRMTARDFRNSYWKEGGVMTAVPGVVIANLMMDDRDEALLVNLFRRVLGSAVLGAVFFLPGALIGSFFPK